MRTKNIHQSVLLPALPNEVFNAFMNSRLHSKFTGAPATIGKTIGSPFTVWEGSINGFTLAIDKGRRIVQAWRSEDWPADHFSTVTFTFESLEGGTRITFDQYSVPEDKHEDITEGWKTYYWEPLKLMFARA